MNGEWKYIKEKEDKVRLEYIVDDECRIIIYLHANDFGEYRIMIVSGTGKNNHLEIEMINPLKLKLMTIKEEFNIPQNTLQIVKKELEMYEYVIKSLKKSLHEEELSINELCYLYGTYNMNKREKNGQRTKMYEYNFFGNRPLDILNYAITKRDVKKDIKRLDKVERKIIKDRNIQKVITEDLSEITRDRKTIYDNEDIKKDIVKEKDIKLHEKASLIDRKSMKKERKYHETERNPIVKAETLRRANGICDLCGLPGPFLVSDTKFLESHHVIGLEKKGPDAIYNTVALCPNCHSRMDRDIDKMDMIIAVDKIFNYLKDDKELLEKAKKLFEQYEINEELINRLESEIRNAKINKLEYFKHEILKAYENISRIRK